MDMRHAGPMGWDLMVIWGMVVQWDPTVQWILDMVQMVQWIPDMDPMVEWIRDNNRWILDNRWIPDNRWAQGWSWDQMDQCPCQWGDLDPAQTLVTLNLGVQVPPLAWALVHLVPSPSLGPSVVGDPSVVEDPSVVVA